jgi:LPS sulfotransferase NodH
MLFDRWCRSCRPLWTSSVLRRRSSGTGSRSVVGAYLEHIVRCRTTPNGVFATKLHWEQYEEMCCAGLAIGVVDPVPPTRRQADAVSTEWVERFEP